MTRSIAIPSSQDYSIWYKQTAYIDKTDLIVELNNTFQSWSAIFFARPRRWGKSLFLSTLKHFFGKDWYKPEYFADKAVAQDSEVMKRAGTYFVLSLDLKPLYTSETQRIDFVFLWMQLLGQLPYLYITQTLGVIREELSDIDKKQKLTDMQAWWFKIWAFLKQFVESYSKKKPILLLIDEYDKPINDCLKTKKNEHLAKDILNTLKSHLYSWLKDIPCITVVTGVNKLSMAGFFSDFNNLSDYSHKTVLWFTEPEVKALFVRMGVDYSDDLKKRYNGYRFRKGNEFNPRAIMKYLENDCFFQAYRSKTWTSPEYFTHLVVDILKVHTLDQWLALLEQTDYTDEIIQLDLINEKNIMVILHYFYYAGLLTVTDNGKFCVPNNDVLSSYKNLIFSNRETQTYVDLRTKLCDGVEQLAYGNVEPMQDFVSFLLHTKYLNQDRTDLTKFGEQTLASDLWLLMKTFVRIDIKREVNHLVGRTDITYIDLLDQPTLWEIKIARTQADIDQKRQEWLAQLALYNQTKNYVRSYLFVVCLETIEVLIVSYEGNWVGLTM